MKTVLIIIALFSVNATACNDHGKKQKGKCSLPPLEMRCTMEDSKGMWCKGWSRRDSEYCN